MRGLGLKAYIRATATKRKIIPSQWTAIRYSSSLDHIHSELTLRKLEIIYDQPNETNSRLLDITLADFLPSSTVSVVDPKVQASWKEGTLPQLRLRPGHHLVYWPPASRLSLLLPDGTDPDQSPGEPFVRRMWAGGRIKFPRASEMPPLDGSLQACSERISNVVIKGNAGDEKIFVTIERCFSRVEKPITQESENRLREQAPTALVEYRDIVFMRENTKKAPASDESVEEEVEPRIVKIPRASTLSHTLTPTEALLFRFSALTFNAHRIHLERAYCRDVEGHRDLLVHGPLSLTLILELLNRYLKDRGEGREISEITYRNVAPLYAMEEMKICLRDKSDGSFDVWVEGPSGGLSVKGSAHTLQKA